MAKKTVEEILRQQKPEFQIAAAQSGDAADAAAQVDAASRSLDELKRKYLSSNAGLDEAVRGAYAPASPDDDVEIVRVEPNAPPSDAEPPTRAKAVVISKKAGKVIGEQG